MNHQSSQDLPNQELMNALVETIPFRYLTPHQLGQIITKAVPRTLDPGERIIHQGDWPDDRLYVLLAGSVRVGLEVPMTLENPMGFDRLTTVEEGHYFGEWEVIFDVPRMYTVKAVTASQVLEIPGEIFRQMLQESAAFAQAMAVILRDRQGIFVAFDRFRAELTRAAAIGHLSIPSILDHYKALEPAIHGGVRQPNMIDGAGLDYAVRRLPDAITHTFALLMRDELPSAYQDPDSFFQRIETPARRRSIWEMLPGKLLVLLRSGTSDMTDFVTCLCLYAVEAQKIRKRIYESNGMKKLKNALELLANQVDQQSTKSKPQLSHQLERPKELKLLWELGFTDPEIESLRQIWPEDLLSRLYDITNHREMFSIDIRRHKIDYNSRRTEIWTHQVGTAVAKVLGLSNPFIPEDLEIHIISSNTHSVTNCLNPWFGVHRQEVLTWAKERHHPLVELTWAVEDDLLYGLVRDYLRAFPEKDQEFQVQAEQGGTYTLPATLATGIQVQILDLEKIKPTFIDPGISGRCKSGLIVNIDYAFGEQAEHIIRNLILLFGKRIRSVHFLGKAGALTGSRGDILIPTSFIEQTTDLVQGLNEELTYILSSPDQIAGFDPNRIHRGPMLTVEGTLLQNRLMLQFYRRIWGIIGLEMEGAHYHRQILESQLTGMISNDLIQNYLYYVSDLPMDHGGNLSKPMAPNEGIPPLYAITRLVLKSIFESD
jgi:CRP-like cAMP-binding protein